MSAPVRLFVETTYHSAFRYGGWGVVHDAGGAATGFAGGERNTTAERIDLMALIAALDGLGAAAAVAVHSASPGVIAAARILAEPPAPGSDGAPAENLDLWAQGLKAVRGRRFTITPAIRARDTPAAFCLDWAEVGQDKAKMKGRFSAAIPKSNLANLKLAP